LIVLFVAGMSPVVALFGSAANLADDDKGLGLGQSRFEKLRYFRNWPTSTRKTEIAFPRRLPPAAAANRYS
jgi:hypothetical protein